MPRYFVEPIGPNALPLNSMLVHVEVNGSLIAYRHRGTVFSVFWQALDGRDCEIEWDPVSAGLPVNLPAPDDSDACVDFALSLIEDFDPEAHIAR